MPDIKQKQRAPVKNINKKVIYAEKIKDNVVNVKRRTNDSTTQNKNENPTNQTTQNIIDIEKYALYKISSNTLKTKNIKEIKHKNVKVIKGVQKNKKLSKRQIKSSNYVAKKMKLQTKNTIKLSQKSYQISKVAVQKITKNTQKLIKAIVQFTKTSLLTTKTVFTLLMAGGWIMVIVVLIVCLMGGAMALYQGNGENMSELGTYNKDAWNNSLVSTAISQLGNKGGEPYWSWYGFDSRVAWCACFVSCAPR